MSRLPSKGNPENVPRLTVLDRAVCLSTVWGRNISITLKSRTRVAAGRMLAVYRKSHPHSQSGPKVELPAP